MIIRHLKKTDGAQLAKLQAEFFEYNRSELLTSEVKIFEEIKDLKMIIKVEFDEFLKKICFIAEIDKDVVGYIEGEIRERKWKVLNQQGWIQEFFVTKNKRNMRIGKALYDKITEEFVKNGCDSFVIGAFVQNNKALNMYKEWGFTERNVMLIKNLK